MGVASGEQFFLKGGGGCRGDKFVECGGPDCHEHFRHAITRVMKVLVVRVRDLRLEAARAMGNIQDLTWIEFRVMLSSNFTACSYLTRPDSSVLLTTRNVYVTSLRRNEERVFWRRVCFLEKSLGSS